MHAFTKRLQGYGRFGDKLLAHLSPKEARILKKAGGAGTVNPFTGALEYYKGTLGGGGVNPLAGDTMPGDETSSDTASTGPVNQPSTMSTEKPQAKDAFLNLANTWQSNQPKEADKGLDPRMLNFAKIMQNTFDRDDPGTQGETRAEYYEGSKSIENMLKYTMGINSNLHDRLIDRGVDDEWNEDKAPGRVDEVMRFMFTPNSQGNTGFEMFGGKDALLEAYEQLGVTGEGNSYADRQVNEFLDAANSIVGRLNEDQTSTTMGDVKGPQHTKTYTGPTAFADAKRDMIEGFTKQLPGITPLSAAAKAAQAAAIAREFNISFATAMGEALGFGGRPFDPAYTPDPDDGEW